MTAKNVTPAPSSLERPSWLAPARPAGGEAYLLVLAGPAAGRVFRLAGRSVTLGRSQEADILLLDEGLSRLHARIAFDGDDVVLTDLGSRNGTFVNGMRVAEARLRDGDRIVLGSTTMLKFAFHDDLEGSVSARLYESALKDGLTGLYNRTYFNERLVSDYSFAARHGSPLAVLLLDVDHLRRINDANGHLAGDAVLKQLAARLQQTVRAEDLLARYGDGELVILARGLDDDHAVQFAERLRRVVLERPFTVGGGSARDGQPSEQGEASLAVTISVGVSVYQPGRYTSEQALLAAAVGALELAKHEGRDRVRMAPLPGPAPLPGG